MLIPGLSNIDVLFFENNIANEFVVSNAQNLCGELDYKKKHVSSANSTISVWTEMAGIPFRDVKILRGNNKKENDLGLVCKVGLPNIPLEKVLEALDNRELRRRDGIEIVDIDFTIDYAGSFDKTQIIDFLVSKRGFRLQNSMEQINDAGTILDNDNQVGRN